MVETIDIYSFIILIIILIALSFGIMNTMMMSILERRHEIGMMMALGMNRFRIISMVFTETFLLTTIGIPIAIGVGYFIIHHYQTTGLDLSSMGKDLMESFGFDPLIYPSLPKEKIPYITMLVFFTALISSILPIWKSLRLDPSTALQK
jgi:ABC-type antimicrobial peptide transport system permease subunit